MIRELLDENLLLLLLLKGKDCHGFDQALLSVFLIILMHIFVCASVFVCVCLSTHWGISVVCGCVCVCVAVCVTTSKRMRELEDMPETQIFHESSSTFKFSLLIYVLD